MYIYIYIYIYIFGRASIDSAAKISRIASPDRARPISLLHPVSVRRFPSFRTQPLENITPLPMNKWIPEQPSPWRKSSKRESCYGDRV